jgi:hypothetical protein
VLQEGEFEPLGSTRTRKVNVRVVAVTNRDLGDMVRDGKFREDLFYRLNVFPLRMPPLRERGADIALLAGAFVERFARRMGRRIEPLHPEAITRLREYAWPGNVRELQNVIERAIIFSPGSRLELHRAMPAGSVPTPPPAAEGDSTRILSAAEMESLERANIERALAASGGKISGATGAARGVRFANAFAQYPVCNPSRTSFLTGLRCEQTGIVGNQDFFRDRWPDLITLPQLLRLGGWITHSFGKIYHTANTGEGQREAWLDVGRSWDKATATPPTLRGAKGEIRNLTGGKLPWCEVGILDGPEDDQPDAQTAAAAIRSMEELSASGKPWMVAAGFHRPHDPFHAPRKYFDLYPKEKLPLYRDPAGMTAAPPLAIFGNWVGTFAKFSDDDRRSFLQAYLAGASFMDAQVGRLLDALDRLRLWDNTVVLFLGDHGYHLGEREWWNKNTLFDRSCRALAFHAMERRHE